MKLIILIFLILFLQWMSQFTWNPDINTDVSISSNPTCPGHYDVTIGGTTYPCFGTNADNVVTEQPCPNGLYGMMINNTLICGTIVEYLSPGGECEFGGYRFESNTLNFTNCYTNLTNFVDSTFVNSPTVTFVKTPTNISANAILTLSNLGIGTSVIGGTSGNTGFFKTFFANGISSVSSNGTNVNIYVPPVSATDATTGGASLFSSFSLNNLVFKQLFGIPGFLEFTTTLTSIQLVSFLTAYNLPYTGFNPFLFPDCPFSTTQSDINVCLAQRSIGTIINGTNAGTVIYYPSTLFKNQSSFSVASAFDILFEDTLPAFTRIWFVDSINGDDDLGNGSPLNPFKSIRKVFTLIGTFSFNDANEVRMNIGTYNEGPLVFPPNTYINADGPLRTIVINVNGSITLRSDWATYANNHVEGGMTGVVLTATSILINFTTMGAAGVNSRAKFSFAQTEVNAPITVYGRSNVDTIHFNTVDLEESTTVNCAQLHLEASTVESNFAITDNACSATVLNYHVQFNYFEHSNFTVTQSTSSGMIVDLFLNGWDQAYVFGYGNFTCNTYTVPLNFFMAGTVTIIHNLNLAGSQMCGLDVTYWGASCLSATDLILILMGRARDQVSVGVGESLLATSTITQDRVKGVIDGSNIIVTADATDVMISTSLTPTFSTVTASAIINQLVLGITNTVTITSPAPAAPRVYTIPDVLGPASFVMTAGAQTIGGVKTFSSGIILPTGNSVKYNNLYDNATVTVSAPAGLNVNTIFTWPPTQGTSGQVLQANGDGSSQWIGIRRRIFESCSNGVTMGALSTAFNTMVAGTACATGPASIYLAANSVNIGSVFDMIISGTISRLGGATVQTRIMVNNTAAVTSLAFDTGAVAVNKGFKATARCVFRTIGVSGTVLCTGDFMHDQMTAVQILSTTSTLTVDTTSVLFFDFQLAFGSSSASNNFMSSMTGMYIAL